MTYIPEKYWKERHERFGIDNFRGVGNITLDDEENKKQYEKAKEIFLKVLTNFKINFDEIKVLDIGCGNGFYTSILKEKAITNYTGLDITDSLFGELKRIFPDYNFKKLDVSTEELNEKFDLIIMIDVAQHIVDEEKFIFALNNIRNSLTEKGIFIITPNIEDENRAEHVIRRNIGHFKKIFNDFDMIEPLDFRDKLITAFYKNEVLK